MNILGLLEKFPFRSFPNSTVNVPYPIDINQKTGTAHVKFRETKKKTTDTIYKYTNLESIIPSSKISCQHKQRATILSMQQYSYYKLKDR